MKHLNKHTHEVAVQQMINRETSAFAAKRAGREQIQDAPRASARVGSRVQYRRVEGKEGILANWPLRPTREGGGSATGHTDVS